jgi:Nucleoside diphosphate kinase
MELSYLLITPSSLRKSRTGGILSRILSRSGLELVGARMFAPSRELVEEFASTPTSGDERHRHTQDSVENAKREMDIIRTAENNLSPLLHAYLS